MFCIYWTNLVLAKVRVSLGDATQCSTYLLAEDLAETRWIVEERGSYRFRIPRSRRLRAGVLVVPTTQMTGLTGRALVSDRIVAGGAGPARAPALG